MTIDLYTWGTPNGRKVSIMLEEVGLPYTVHTVDIGKDEQFAPDFLKISPNNKIPAIVDPDGPGGEPLALFESGAILTYLGDKTGGSLWPADPRKRAFTQQWLMFQMGGLGPMFGQANHFLHFNPGVSDYAEKRYRTEAQADLAAQPSAEQLHHVVAQRPGNRCDRQRAARWVGSRRGSAAALWAGRYIGRAGRCAGLAGRELHSPSEAWSTPCLRWPFQLRVQIVCALQLQVEVIRRM